MYIINAHKFALVIYETVIPPPHPKTDTDRPSFLEIALSSQHLFDQK